jgi:fumarate hydratase class II
VCAQVVGNDGTVAFAGSAGTLELNVMMPVMARNLLESIRLLGNASRLLADRCIDGITANAERAETLAASSPSIVTPLNRYVGYENAAKIAKAALAEDRTIKQTTYDLGFVSEQPEPGKVTPEQLDAALDLLSMTRPSPSR